jgi:glucokinase
MLYLTLSTVSAEARSSTVELHRGAAGNGGELRSPHGAPRRAAVQLRPARLRRGVRVGHLHRRTRPGGAGRRREIHDGGAAEVTAADVAAAAAAGDAVAAAVWAETVDLLGAAVTDLVNAFEPDLVVLGGGVTRSGAMLIDPVRISSPGRPWPPPLAPRGSCWPSSATSSASWGQASSRTQCCPGREPTTAPHRLTEPGDRTADGGWTHG